MKRVEVRWLDSVGGGPWAPAAEAAGEPRAQRHTSIGFLAVDKPAYITVCSSRQDITDTVTGCVTIPRVAIRRMRTL